MADPHETPFDSIESARQYVQLLCESLQLAREGVQEDLAAASAEGAGRRVDALRLVGYKPLPDIYDQPLTTLDASVSIPLLGVSRVKLTGKNLLDPLIRQLQGPQEIVSARRGRVYSIAYVYGS